jgi:hypothetical protein
MDEKIIHYDRDVYYKNAVLAQPGSTSRHVRIVLDSRERNVSLFPNPNAYEINLVHDIHNVSHIRLISSDFPFNTYTINASNNRLYVAYNDTVTTVVLDIGNYTETELATELGNSMNAAVGTAIFQVAYVPKKDNFSFKCLHPFGLVFAGRQFVHPMNGSMDKAYTDNSIGRVIGFGINNYISSVHVTGDSYVNVIKSEFRKNFNTDDCVVVRIDTLEVNVSTADVLQDSFAIVTKNYDSSVNYYGNDVVSHRFTPKLPRLSKLKVRLVDYYGAPYDFQNRDHRLEFEVVCDGR